MYSRRAFQRQLNFRSSTYSLALHKTGISMPNHLPSIAGIQVGEPKLDQFSWRRFHQIWWHQLLLPALLGASCAAWHCTSFATLWWSFSFHLNIGQLIEQSVESSARIYESRIATQACKSAGSATQTETGFFLFLAIKLRLKLLDKVTGTSFPNSPHGSISRHMSSSRSLQTCGGIGTGSGKDLPLLPQLGEWLRNPNQRN